MSVDDAKSVTHCHLSDDIHVILFRLVLVQNTSHRDIRWTHQREPVAARVFRQSLKHCNAAIHSFIHSGRNEKWQFKQIVVVF
ncbi:hypothetical protein [Paraburkholderia sp. 32]|uniref:hypothetical protein n=1 Tax=Paraburkholderia sp. 32 TaxID=2991057 RepID=UPI003D198897